LIRDARPDVAFLDVQMPTMTGIDVAASLVGDADAGSPLPLIVFVTAYDAYAVKAFELSACDYLLKPFDASRLSATMQRVQARLGDSPTSAVTGTMVRALLAHVAPANASPIVVKADGRHVFLDPTEVEWIEAVGKDARIHLLVAGASPLVVRESMSSLESRLDATTFLRVHRSAIVNTRQIREVQPWFKGDFVLILRRGTRIVSGRTYRDAVQRLITHGRTADGSLGAAP
jgi:two-component system LytT family response regulator